MLDRVNSRKGILEERSDRASMELRSTVDYYIVCPCLFGLKLCFFSKYMK